MITLVTLIHIIVCFFIIIVVLLQSGSAGDVAAAFGGMGSQTAFGPRGATTLLGKLTAWSTVLFMLTSITLSVYASRQRTGSVLEGVKAPATKSQPVGQGNQPQPPTTPATPK
jgi:preprotein translocase subunit SecG